MLITGSTYRSIASQNILSYSINGNINNTTGISSFGLSGDNGLLNLFTFKTGKVYDINNRHIWSYNPSENFVISGNINTGDHHYYINDNLICLSTPKQDHYYKYFYANAENSIMDLDIYVIGNNSPNYSINFPFTYTMGDNITGYVKNNSENNNFSFQFFTGETVGQLYYSLSSLDNKFISGVQSGEFILQYTSALNPESLNSGAGELEPLIGNLIFNTNFGNITYNLNIPINKKPYYFIDFVEIFTGIIQQNSLFNYNYIYELRTKSPDDQNVFISLSNKTGHLKELYTGSFNSTGVVFNTLSGFIYGNDYITGLLTGTTTSTSSDYYGDLVEESTNSFVSIQQDATGFINYYYNILITGGSGLSTPPPGISFEATGFINDYTGISFIYESRIIKVEGTETGYLSGYWNQYFQTGTGIINLTGDFTEYFTGNSNIDNIHFNWDSIPYISYDIDNYNSNYDYRIYGITGSGDFTFISSDSGILTTGLTTQQATGELINYLFRLSSYDISFISGEVFGSENSENLIYVFGQDSDAQWGTSSNISTGYLGFEFANFNPNDSGIITHYELNLDRNFFDYRFVPAIFKLQGSNNNISWADLDSRSAINFYRSQTNIFRVANPGSYNYIRLLITSGEQLQHVNQNDLDSTNYGLSINKIYFYEKSLPQPITGLYKNFIDNDVTGNYFYSSFNTGIEQDYFFSNDEGADLYFASQLDKNFYPYVEITGGFIGYKTAYAYTGNKITGFYISFEPGYTPQKLTIEASTGINYKTFYENGVNSNIESNTFSGINIIEVTGYNHFRFNFGDDWGRDSANCITGWKAASSPNPSALYEWNDIALSNTAQRSLLVSNFVTGEGPYTGYVFQNQNGYNGAFIARAFTGNSSSEVKLRSVAFDKNTGKHVLISRDAETFYYGNTPGAPDYKIHYHNNFFSTSNQTTPIGFDGSWLDVAMSHDARVMAAVGYYDFDFDISAQISWDTGVTWNNISYLNGYNLNSIAMSSGGRVIYCARRSSDIVDKSIDSGNNWEVALSLFQDTKDVATDNDGKYVVVASHNGIYNSNDSGVNWSSSTPGNIFQWEKVAMSNDGKFQLAISDNDNQVARSEDYGVDWQIITGLNDLDLKSAAMSNDGKFQYIIGHGTRLYNNCTYGNYLPEQPPVRIKKLNLYASREKDFFDLNSVTITGFGNKNISSSGFGTGLLTNPTGEIYFPAVSYQTGLLTGLITEGGSYTWNNIFISSTGSPNNVFLDIVTGFTNATGVIKFNMDLIRPDDNIAINDVSFTYSSEISNSNYSFDNLWKLINVLNSGAKSSDFTLSNTVGVTGNITVESYGTGLLTGLGAGNLYGESVDISDNNVIVVGGPNDNSSNGAAIIYTRNEDNNWNYYQKITGSSAGKYGTDVQTNNDSTKIVMSGPDANLNLGGFVVYSGNKTNGWSLQQFVGGYYFSPPGVGGYARYNNVAINSGDIIAIGGYNWGSETGIVALYQGASNFTFANIITAPPSITSSASKPRFGSSVALNNRGNILVVGAPHTVGGYGNVCIFNTSILASPPLVQKIDRPDNDVSNLSSFGSSLGINNDGNIIVVGTPAFSTGTSTLIGGYRVGLVSIYTGTLENGWNLRQNITGTINNQFFGNKVDISSDGNIIGVCNGGNTVDNIYINYAGNPINGWSPIISASGLKNTSSIAVNNSITVGGYNSLNLAAFSQINNATMELFSYNPSGEDGNNTKLTRDANNLNAIKIPNRYLAGGETFRPLLNTWEGNFEQTFNLTKENSGIYFVSSQENISTAISGVVYENNFYPNWSGYVTLISEGTVLNTGLTIRLLPDSSQPEDLLTGMYTIPNGLSYLGYSGLNINFNKYIYDNSKTTLDLAEYSITGNKFTYTGIIRG